MCRQNVKEYFAGHCSFCQDIIEKISWDNNYVESIKIPGHVYPLIKSRDTLFVWLLPNGASMKV